MQTRICTSCDEPHLTSDWYPVIIKRKPIPGAIECAPSHEDRVRRETRDSLFSLPKGHNPNEEAA